MKIAFVGKGGSGKTTASSLFAQYNAQHSPTLAIDADINIHMAELLTGEQPNPSLLISEKTPSAAIRRHLIGDNTRIKNTDHFKKSTPPGQGSQLIDVANSQDWFMRHYATFVSNNLSLAAVGSYSEAGVASSCYHNNLSILENILSHTIDSGTIVADMVAGTDAFASTLFSQFDMLVFVVEPTSRSISVLHQYIRLATHAGVDEKLYIIANKIEDEDDMQFIRESITQPIIGTMSRSSHLLNVDKGREKLDVTQLHSSDQIVFATLAKTLQKVAKPNQSRLPGLWELHKIYVNQPFVKDRFGDLSSQIDSSFTYPAS